jgi:IclR family KDG regulon transcriptional repressor
MSPKSRTRRAVRRRPATVKALERGLRILNVLADRGRLPLGELAQRGDFSLGTARHLVKTLEALGYVAQAPDRRWGIAGRVFQLVAAAWDGDELARLGESTVRDLGMKTGEATQLAIFDRRDVIVVSKLDGAGPERLFERLGAPRPAYCTALGKALLAYQHDSVVNTYLASTKLRRFTPKTITSAARLREQLREIRRHGFAVDDEEFSQGIRCVAAPVFNFTNRAVAALGMFGAAWRISPQRMSTCVTLVTQQAERLSRELAYREPYPPPAED